MKNNFLTHLIIIIATTIFVGCSKDDTLIKDQPGITSMTHAGKMVPDPNGGTVTGTFDPTPKTVDVSVAQGEWLVVGVSTSNNEGFVVNQIPPGTYDARIIYTTENNNTERMIIIKSIGVNGKETVDLGTITLE